MIERNDKSSRLPDPLWNTEGASFQACELAENTRVDPWAMSKIGMIVTTSRKLQKCSLASFAHLGFLAWTICKTSTTAPWLRQGLQRHCCASEHFVAGEAVCDELIAFKDFGSASGR